MRTAPILVTKDQKQTKEARREKKKTSVYGCNFVYFYFLLCCFDLILYSFFKGSHFDIYCTRYKHNDLKKKDFGAFKEILHH